MQVQLVIVLDPETGQLQVSGPLQNKLVCLGMLEMAKVQVMNYEHKAVVPAREVPAQVSGQPAQLRRV